MLDGVPELCARPVCLREVLNCFEAEGLQAHPSWSTLSVAVLLGGANSVTELSCPEPHDVCCPCGGALLALAFSILASLTVSCFAAGELFLRSPASKRTHPSRTSYILCMQYHRYDVTVSAGPEVLSPSSTPQQIWHGVVRCVVHSTARR